MARQFKLYLDALNEIHYYVKGKCSKKGLDKGGIRSRYFERGRVQFEQRPKGQRPSKLFFGLDHVTGSVIGLINGLCR